MVRSISAAVGMVALAGAANAAFLGLHIQEVTGTLPPGTSLPTGLRTFRVFAEFDGAGTAAGAGRTNVVLSVGNSNPSGGAPLFWGANLTNNPGANFFQATAAQGATASNVGGPDIAFGSARALYDSYVSIGLLTQDSDSGIADTSGPDPDYGFGNGDGVTGVASLGLGAGHDRISGGWFNTSPPNLQGAAVADAGQGGKFLTFLAQVSIANLAGGSQLGSRMSSGVFKSDVFTGELTIATQAAGSGADLNRVVFMKVPTPGAVALFGLAGLTGLRRRR